MSFECSLKILIENNNLPDISPLALGLPSNYFSKMSTVTGCLSISVDDFEFQDWSEFDRCAHDFIGGLNFISCRLALENSVFKVAIYYNINETAVLPLRISSSLIKRISDMSFSLDATGYPCSDDVAAVTE
jgi:hypothetical protein